MWGLFEILKMIFGCTEKQETSLHKMGYSRILLLVVIEPRHKIHGLHFFLLRKNLRVIYCHILQYLAASKLKFSEEKMCYFSYFCSKHRSWIHVRTASLTTEAVLTSTHNLRFRAK